MSLKIRNRFSFPVFVSLLAGSQSEIESDKVRVYLKALHLLKQDGGRQRVERDSSATTEPQRCRRRRPAGGAEVRQGQRLHRVQGVLQKANQRIRNKVQAVSQILFTFSECSQIFSSKF